MPHLNFPQYDSESALSENKVFESRREWGSQHWLAALGGRLASRPDRHALPPRAICG